MAEAKTDLEARMRNGTLSRRDLLKLGISGIASLPIIGLLQGCKSPSSPTPPPVSKTYNIAVSNMDIFNNTILGGDYILNGTKAASGMSTSIKSNQTDGSLLLGSIDIDALPSYKGAYIVLADMSGNIYLTRDAGGQHSGPTKINDNTSLFAKVIPSDFNTQLLAQSIFSGYIVNFHKQNIPVGIMNAGQEPTQTDIGNLNKIINMINDAAKGVIILTYTGITTSELTNGVTYKLEDTYASHNQTLSGYIITKSKCFTRSEAVEPGVLAFLFEELTQTSAGLVADVPGMGFAYRGGSATNPIFINDGARAIQLANLLPPGFQLDVANNSPAVQKYINPVIPVDPNSVANPHQAFYNQNPGAGINNGPGKNDQRGNQRIRN